MPSPSRAQARPERHEVLEKLLYGRKDVAFALSISLRTVDRLIASQDLRTRRLRGRVVIPAAEVKRLANQVIHNDLALARARLERVK